LVAALIPTVVEAVSGAGILQAEWATYQPVPLRLELPERVYFPSARSHPVEQSKAGKLVAAERRTPVQPAAGAGSRAAVSLPRQMELPVTRHISDQAPVILQPDLTAMLAPTVPAVPPLAFWTKASEPPPRRRAVVPGRMQVSSALPNLDAPPVLSPSNPQPVASNIAADLAAAQSTPKLPLPNSSAAPVRIHGKGGAEIASFDVPQSDPVNLIYLMAENSATRQVEIPRGLQNTPRSSADGGAGMTPGSAADDVAKSVSSLTAARNRTVAGAGGAARAGGAAGAAGAATEGADGAARTPGSSEAAGTAVGSRAAANRTAAGAGQQNAAGANEPHAAAGAPSSPRGKSETAEVNPANRPPALTGAHVADPAQTSAAVIRTVHPANGNFDVVILQSVTRDDLPDVGGTLSGNPVYTVYLSVGDAREWLLEYCIPASVNPRASSYQVNIDDPGAVSAPYPVSTVIPRNVFELLHAENIVLHGLLSVAGLLREVKATNMESALAREVLPLLSQWQFRPALRDKVPVEVEILLIIPPRT
jgi:hypothetical protein